ncbi:MAG: hypothetical protein IJV48_06150 [Ruminococcus sp.]|nr:hypothetical protein [Ruminococcus sp.]
MTVKRISALFICIVLILSLCACGDVSRVQVIDVPSQLYTQEDIRAAIEVIKSDFAQDWDHCSLLSIQYAGDELMTECYTDDTNEFESLPEMYDADEAIILYSAFYVSPAAEYDVENTLAVDTTYEYWKWILVRDKGGTWRHVDHGYG